MRPACHAALVCYLVVGSLMAYCQGASVPFGKLQRDAQVPPVELASNAAGMVSAGPASSAVSANGLVAMRPARADQPQMIDRRYLLLNSVHLGMALFDVEMTQRCMAEQQCKEGNPMMPSSQAGQIGVGLGVAAFTAVDAYWARKHNVRTWWMAPAAGIAAHTAGVATGFAHR
jgi:hypothetical protein